MRLAIGAVALPLLAAACRCRACSALPESLLRRRRRCGSRAYASWLGWLLTRERIGKPMAWTVIGINALWTVGSLGLLASGTLSPTTWGTAFVIAQAVVVLVFAELQFFGVKRLR